MKWIDITEKRPTPGDTVLTYPHYRVLPFGNCDWFHCGNFSDYDFWDYNSEGDVVEVTPYPTHWMKLPNPPSQGKILPATEAQKLTDEL